MITKSKKLAHQYFDDEYELTDTPEFRYEIHLNKCSCGWRPLFQKHKAFSTFQDLEKFYMEHKEDIIIEDEYGDKYSFKEYKNEIVEHGSLTPEPMKFVVVNSGLYGGVHLDPQPCKPNEAEVWCPFNHREYQIAEAAAQKKLKAWEANIGWIRADAYEDDPDYPIDWYEGDFV